MAPEAALDTQIVSHPCNSWADAGCVFAGQKLRAAGAEGVATKLNFFLSSDKLSIEKAQLKRKNGLSWEE